MRPRNTTFFRSFVRLNQALPLLLGLSACKKSTGDPEVDRYLEIFETESREVFKHRKDIVAAMGIKPGEAVADIGAGTGAFLEPLAHAVGPKGKLYAVDIAPNFIEHLRTRAQKLGLSQVQTVLSTTVSVTLAKDSIDKALVCATYHHFGDTQAMMGSIKRALKPGGEVFIVDFVRIEGVTTDEWVLDHVRAGEKTFTKEILKAGFVPGPRPKAPFLKQNYMVRFRRGDITKERN